MRVGHACCHTLRRSSGARRGKREKVVGSAVEGILTTRDDDASLNFVELLERAEGNLKEEERGYLWRGSSPEARTETWGRPRG
jgi:hypothetical protein